MRVLLVEDDKQVARCTIKMLRAALVDVEVDLEPTVPRALAVLSEEVYDAVVSDYDLGMGGGGTGADVLAWITAHRPALAKRFVFFTGSPEKCGGRAPTITKGIWPDDFALLVRRYFGVAP